MVQRRPCETIALGCRDGPGPKVGGGSDAERVPLLSAGPRRRGGNSPPRADRCWASLYGWHRTPEWTAPSTLIGCGGSTTAPECPARRRRTRFDSSGAAGGHPGAPATSGAGEQLIPVASIVGSVDGIQLFDRNFRPVGDRARARLGSVLVAMRQGEPFSPIEVWAWRGEYYVLDGHHRVAAARALQRLHQRSCH